MTAIKAIEEALSRFVGNGSSTRVMVGETQHGHVFALVGSDQLREMGLGERQIKIWDFIRENVAPEHRGLLYSVTPLDEEEFDDLMRQAQIKALEELS